MNGIFAIIVKSWLLLLGLSTCHMGYLSKLLKTFVLTVITTLPSWI